MQRRAQRDARTPDKMKRNQSLVADGNLSLEEKKRKIVRSLRRLEALGVLTPPDSEAQILQMIAKVDARIWSVGQETCPYMERWSGNMAIHRSDGQETWPYMECLYAYEL